MENKLTRNLSPTTRSQRWFEAKGYRCDVCERRLTHRISKDLFGIFDLVAIREGETIGIQATDHTNVSKRVRKITDSEALSDVRDAGWTILVLGWRKDRDDPRVVDLS